MVYGVVWWFSGGGYGNLDNACYVTHEARPTDIVPSTTSTVMSSGSVPIATSTPVNLAAGPVSPPPLSLGITQSVPHQEQNALGGGKSATTTAGSTTATSYPAVLKGRSGASPPNPNLVPSGKVPPPVPPRGSGARSARSPGPTTTSSSSITSSRGDEAALITSRQYRLHDSSTILHHRPLPYNTSTTTTTTTTTFDTPTTIFNTTTITTTTTTTTTIGTNEYPTMSASIYDALHARAFTPAFLPPCHENLPLVNDVIRNRGVIVEEPPEQQDDEEEEFVSVEKIDDRYFIKTSPCPFRPERRKYKSTTDVTMQSTKSYPPIEDISKPTKKIDHMAKFTYFINPASRDDLMNYKMSRKDKKHSETYHERMKRKQMEIDASINTITAITQQNLSDIQFDSKSRSWRMFDSTEKLPNESTNVISRTTEKNPSKIVEVKKENRLLKKIKEKSIKRKKRLAPIPNSKRQFNRDFDEAGQKRIMKEIEKVSLEEDPSSSTYVDGTASCDNVNIDIQSVDTSYQRSTHYYDQVDQRLENIRKDHRERIFSPIASTSSKEPQSGKFLTKFTRKESKMTKMKSGLNKKTVIRDQSGTLPSTCSTPPPPFDDAVRSNDQTLASGGHLQQAVTTSILTSSLSSAHSKHNKVVHHVTLTKSNHDAVSISDVHLESSGSGSGSGGRETKSSLSVESGGSSRGGGGLTWTPPAGSAEGSTPTWTEGTPSFTESSSSGDIGCPTTPIRGSHRSEDGGRIAATVEEALASLTTEMKRTSQMNVRGIGVGGGGGDGQSIQLEQRSSFSMYRHLRTSLKRTSSNHVAIMKTMQRALNVRRREP
ncbi:hypothetical protein M0804_011522 [Polistes exclamans]|nr:hypothetical protein M0804_011522 [Polistes exclamans]